MEFWDGRSLLTLRAGILNFVSESEEGAGLGGVGSLLTVASAAVKEGVELCGREFVGGAGSAFTMGFWISCNTGCISSLESHDRIEHPLLSTILGLDCQLLITPTQNWWEGGGGGGGRGLSNLRICKFGFKCALDP